MINHKAIYEEYMKGTPIKVFAKKFNITSKNLRNQLRNRGFILKTYSEAFKLSGNSNWKSGRHIRKNNSQVFIRVNGKQKLEHIQIWEKNFIGMPKGFVIHHVDLDATNNDINNLMLMTRSEHTSFHNSLR